MGSLNVLPLKRRVGQYIAMHAMLTARDFFLTYSYPSGPFTCIFSKTSSNFFLCWLWLTLVPVQARRIKQATLLDAGSCVECPWNINWLKKHDLWPCSGELQTQKLKSHLMRTQSLNILPLKPGVGQYIAIRAMLTARDFFLTYFYPSGPFTCIFSKSLPIFSPCWPLLTPVSVQARRVKQVTLLDAGSCVECGRNMNRPKKT